MKTCRRFSCILDVISRHFISQRKAEKITFNFLIKLILRANEFSIKLLYMQLSQDGLLHVLGSHGSFKKPCLCLLRLILSLS